MACLREPIKLNQFPPPKPLESVKSEASALLHAKSVIKRPGPKEYSVGIEAALPKKN